ncbi:MAG: type IX secretion system membrane protein PorP/SprF [Flavobacteriales bacterium]|nr:type IX secretion system membrane protein PorP/SprF [Flavobacteriales bacterium]
MSSIRSILSIAGALCAATLVAQHTPLTSQYLFNGLVINPAYAGSRDALTGNLTHRQQWVGFEGAPITQTISIHSPVGRTKMGLGLLLYNDRIGVSNETGVFGNYAYRVRMGEGKLSLGLGAGFTVLRANWADVALQQDNDQVFSGNTQAAIRPNFSTGAFYYTKTWFVGISMPFLLVHRYDVSDVGFRFDQERLDAQPMLTGGYVLELTEDLKLKPSALLRYRLESGMQVDLSSNLIIKDKVWAGISYRTGDAIIGMVEVLPTPQWRFGYAYDLGLSAIRPYHSGSHELLVQYEFGYRIRVRDPRYF